MLLCHDKVALAKNAAKRPNKTMAARASVANLLPIFSSSSSSSITNPSPLSRTDSSNSVNVIEAASCDVHFRDPSSPSPHFGQNRRNKLHHSPLPPTRLFDDHSKNHSLKSTFLKISSLFHRRKPHLLHPQPQRRRWTLSQMLSSLLIAFMLLSVWMTLGMTLVLLCRLDTIPYLHSFPTLSPFRHYQESSRLQRRRSPTNLSKPRVILYYYPDASMFSGSLSSRWLDRPSPLQRDANDTYFWELPPLSPNVLPVHDDAHYDVSSTSQQQKKSSTTTENADCVPMASWQTDSFPSCNILHEIDLTNLPMSLDRHAEGNVSAAPRSNYNHDALYILGQGWFRITWKYDTFKASVENHPNPSITLEPESVVLKTLRLDRDFSAEFFELHRRDAVAMERLTFSPYVMNIYGYCGQSALNELADFNVGGMTRLEELSRRLRSQPHTPHLYMTKLQLAYQVAMALYHVHELPNQLSTTAMKEKSLQQQRHLHMQTDDHNQEGGAEQREYRPVMVHYDVNPRNVALVRGGRAKLNDFNTCEFLPWNPNTRTTCGFRGRFHEPWWRAPEEMPPIDQNGTDLAAMKDNQKSTKLTQMLQEKVDIYALGNILFHVLTTHSPRGKMKASRLLTVQEMVTKGQRPPLPTTFQLVVPSKDGAAPPISPEDANYTYSQYYEHYDAVAPQEVAIVAFLQAMDGCYPMDPSKRWTARQVANVLRQAMQRINRMVLMQNVTSSPATTSQ